MPQLCVLWTHWHHSPSWAVSVNLQEGKELGGALVTFSCFPTPGWVLHFLKRKELCTAESAPGSAHYTSDSQGETSAKASYWHPHILTDCPAAVSFTALQVGWIKMNTAKLIKGRCYTALVLVWAQQHPEPSGRWTIFRSDWATLRAVWAGKAAYWKRVKDQPAGLCLPAVLPGTWTVLGREMRPKKAGLAGS